MQLYIIHQLIGTYITTKYIVLKLAEKKNSMDFNKEWASSKIAIYNNKLNNIIIFITCNVLSIFNCIYAIYKYNFKQINIILV